VLGPDGASPRHGQGRDLFRNTTASADIAREFQAGGQKKGMDFIDAPVSERQAGARDGQLR